MTVGSNDVRTKLIGPVLGCLPLKTSSDDDDVMVCGVFGMGMMLNYGQLTKIYPKFHLSPEFLTKSHFDARISR